MALLIFFVALALGVSFLCSVMEAVLLSVTPGYLGALEQEGNPIAPKLRALKDDIDRPLAAILSLNTIAHTVGATGAGAQAVEVFGDAWIGVFSAVLTLLILVASEIIPKTLGAVYWRQLSGPVVRILGPMMTLLWPLVAVSKVLTRWLSGGKVHAPVSREEIAAMADIGQAYGALAEGESRILKSLMRFRSLRAKDVMTPRPVVSWLRGDATVGQVVEEPATLRFSRLPLTGKGLDDVASYALKDEILLRAARDELDLPLAELARPIQVVPDGLALPAVLEQLLETGEHIALVVDEFGGAAGVVSLEDVIETLLGMEIVDEVDSVEDMQALARKKWRERAARLGLVPEGVELVDGA